MTITQLPADPDSAATELLRRAAFAGRQAALDAHRAALQPSAETQVLRATVAQHLHDRSAAYRGAAKMTQYFREQFEKQKV